MYFTKLSMLEIGVGHTTTSYSSTDTLSSGNQSPHSPFQCTPTPWRGTYFSQLFRTKMGNFIRTHIFLAMMLVLFGNQPMSLLSVFSGRKVSSIFLVSHLEFFPLSAVSMTKFHFQRKRQGTRDPPVFDISISTVYPYFCIF